MKGKIIIKKNKQNSNWILSLLIFLLGIVLVTNSNSIVTLTFQGIGFIILLFGIYRLIQFFNLKKQFKTEDNDILISAIIAMTIGFLTILLASIFEIGLRYIIGFYLIISGINKINIGLNSKKLRNFFIINLISGIIFLVIGLYTIFYANAAFIIIGIILIISSILDLFNFLKNK